MLITKDIPGYEGLYGVRNDGVILRYLKHGDPKVLKGSVNKYGYITVALSDTSYNKSGIRHMFAHRIIAEAFVDNGDTVNNVVVDHIDENKTNNHPSNLRWCTPIQNTSYYSQKDGRAYHTKLRKKHKRLMSKLIAEIRKERQEVKHQQHLVEIANKEIETMRIMYSKAEDEFHEDITKFERYKEVELKKLELKGADLSTYIAKKGSRKKIEGKAIVVDGVKYPSAYQATSYIVDCEEVLGNNRNHNTVSKEIRRFIAGKRPSWVMYEKYTIGY